MAEKISELIRQYQGGKITRRQFMRRAVALTGSLAASYSLIDALTHSRAYAGEVDPDDPALLCHDVEYAGRATAVFGYLARPAASGKFPTIIVIHSNQGLNEYTRDVARRFAKKAMSVSLLTACHGTAGRKK